MLEVHNSLVSHTEPIAKLLEMIPSTRGRIAAKSFAEEMIAAETEVVKKYKRSWDRCQA